MSKSSSQKKKFEELHETMPAPPLADRVKKTIVFHGALYHFPSYTDEQIDAMKANMDTVNQSYSYSKLNSLLESIAPYRIGPARTRRPGERVRRGKVRIERK